VFPHIWIIYVTYMFTCAHISYVKKVVLTYAWILSHICRHICDRIMRQTRFHNRSNSPWNIYASCVLHIWLFIIYVSCVSTYGLFSFHICHL